MRRIWRYAAPGAALAVLGMAVAVKAQDAPGGGPSNVQVSDEGKLVYEQICQACHMADAKGGGGAGAAIPALANNPNLAKPEFMIEILQKGRGGMPWFTDMLTPAQMAAVITYVRSHFNNYPDPVTEADVKRFAAGGGQKPDCNCAQ
jgi:mono/diheme cytochrome c family protein